MSGLALLFSSRSSIVWRSPFNFPPRVNLSILLASFYMYLLNASMSSGIEFLVYFNSKRMPSTSTSTVSLSSRGKTSLRRLSLRGALGSWTLGTVVSINFSSRMLMSLLSYSTSRRKAALLVNSCSSVCVLFELTLSFYKTANLKWMRSDTVVLEYEPSKVFKLFWMLW